MLYYYISYRSIVQYRRISLLGGQGKLRLVLCCMCYVYMSIYLSLYIILVIIHMYIYIYICICLVSCVYQLVVSCVCVCVCVAMCVVVKYVVCVFGQSELRFRTEGDLLSCFKPRTRKPRSLESKVRERCTKKLYGALRKHTLHV